MAACTTPAGVLDREFLNIRAKILDLAAALDRVERDGKPTTDPRCEQIRRGLGVLSSAGTERAEQVQHVFSLPYDAAWRTEG